MRSSGIKEDWIDEIMAMKGISTKILSSHAIVVIDKKSKINI